MFYENQQKSKENVTVIQIIHKILAKAIENFDNCEELNSGILFTHWTKNEVKEIRKD